jgi:hypothetical protein
MKAFTDADKAELQSFLTSALDGYEMSDSYSGRLTPENSPHISNEHEAGRPLEPLSRCGRLTGGKNLMPLPGFEIPIAQSVVQLLWHNKSSFNLLQTKRNVSYITNQSVPRSKQFIPRL